MKPANQVNLQGFILQAPDGQAYVFCSSEMPEYGYVTVCPHVLSFTIPAGFDMPPVPELLDRLTA